MHADRIKSASRMQTNTLSQQLQSPFTTRTEGLSRAGSHRFPDFRNIRTTNSWNSIKKCTSRSRSRWYQQMLQSSLSSSTTSRRETKSQQSAFRFWSTTNLNGRATCRWNCTRSRQIRGGESWRCWQTRPFICTWQSRVTHLATDARAFHTRHRSRSSYKIWWKVQSNT